MIHLLQDVTRASDEDVPMFAQIGPKLVRSLPLQFPISWTASAPSGRLTGGQSGKTQSGGRRFLGPKMDAIKSKMHKLSGETGEATAKADRWLQTSFLHLSIQDNTVA